MHTVKWWNSPIWTIDGSLLGTTSSDQNEPGSNSAAFWLVNACNKGQTMVWEEIVIYSLEKVYTIERLLVDKNIGLVNTE